jgi:hypothetical protein
VSFGYFPATISAARKLKSEEPDTVRLASEEGIEFMLRSPRVQGDDDKPLSIFLAVLNEDEAGTAPEWLKQHAASHRIVVLCEPRGIGPTKWTRKNGPNYVERSHALLGRTVDAGRVWDVIAAARHLTTQKAGDPVVPVYVGGKGAAGLLAAYAAALDDSIAGAILVNFPTTHMDNAAPQLLNVLRVCDVPDSLGLIAPRPLRIIGGKNEEFAATKAAYAAAGASEKLRISE